ncbi:hypothetical protein [Sphingobacterium faecium]|uniref:hypothetical protein n=1 Tax=Sphingobacterium faecium TaxID=34087 RepID=UPI00320B5D5A
MMILKQNNRDILIKQGPSNAKDELIINYIYEYFNNGNIGIDKINQYNSPSTGNSLPNGVKLAKIR